MKPNIRIEEYKVAADTVSIGGIRWLTKWDVKVQFSDHATAIAWKERIGQMLQGEALAQPEQEHWLLESTQTLAKTLAREFYPEVTQWNCLNDLAGVISQIDNMTTGLMRKPEPHPTGCACRWDAEGDRVVTCARHEGWLEVIAEWADRAREAEKKLKALPQRQPLTDEQIDKIILDSEITLVNYCCDIKQTQFARAVEAAHGIKAAA